MTEPPGQRRPALLPAGLVVLLLPAEVGCVCLRNTQRTGWAAPYFRDRMGHPLLPGAPELRNNPEPGLPTALPSLAPGRQRPLLTDGSVAAVGKLFLGAGWSETGPTGAAPLSARKGCVLSRWCGCREQLPAWDQLSWASHWTLSRPRHPCQTLTISRGLNRPENPPRVTMDRSGATSGCCFRSKRLEEPQRVVCGLGNQAEGDAGGLLVCPCGQLFG